jgi:hypothetical protein
MRRAIVAVFDVAGGLLLIVALACAVPAGLACYACWRLSGRVDQHGQPVSQPAPPAPAKTTDDDGVDALLRDIEADIARRGNGRTPSVH